MQIAKNIASGWTLFIVRVVAMLLLTPYILGKLGLADYGLWALIISVTTGLDLLDFGTGNGLRRYYSNAIGANDREKQQGYLGAALTIYTGLASVILVITAFLVFGGPDLFDLDNSAGQRFRVVMILLGIRAAVVFLFRPFGGVITAHERFDFIYLLHIASVFISGIAVFGVLFLGYGVIGMASVSLIVTLLLKIAEYFLAHKKFGPLRPKFSFQVSFYMSQLLRYSAVVVVISVCDFLRMDLNIFLVSAITDLKTLAYYAIAFQFVSYVASISTTVTVSYGPRISRLQGEDSPFAIVQEVIICARVSSGILMFVLIMMWFLAKSFLVLWLDPSFGLSYQILQIMIPAMAFGYSLQALSSYLFATSQHSLYAKISLVEVVVDVLKSESLLNKIGVFGAAWGTLIAVLVVRVLWLLIGATRRMKIDSREFLVQAYARSVIFSIVFAAILSALNSIEFFDIVEWNQLIAVVFCACLIGVFVAWRLLLTSAERESTVGYIRSLV